MNTAEFNHNVELQEGTSVSTNGLPMTDGFDLAVYIKGDRKPTALFNAQLVIEYDGDNGEDPGDPPPADVTDVSMTLMAQSEVTRGDTFWTTLIVENFGTTEVTAGLTLTCATNREEELVIVGVPESITLAPFGSDPSAGVDREEIPLSILADSDKATKIDCTATVTVAEDIEPADYDLTNNTQSVTIKVVKP